MTEITSLPSELSRHIIGQLASRDLISLSAVSRAHWLIASAQLWEEVDGVYRLFGLMWGKGKNPLPSSCTERQNLTRSYFIKRMPKNLGDCNFDRFQAYSGFVKTLYVGRAVLPDTLHAELIGRRPLLPNLRNLFVSRTRHREWHWDRCANDVEDLLLLFLNSSVTRFAVSCNLLAIDPEKLTMHAPNLTDLRLGASHVIIDDTITPPHRLLEGYVHNKDPMNLGFIVMNQPGAWSTKFAGWFTHMASLSHLTVTGAFIQAQKSLEFLRSLPALQVFTIVEPDADNWTVLGSKALDFKFIELALRDALLVDVENVLHCGALMACVRSLTLSVVRGVTVNDFDQFYRVLRLLATRVSTLQRLHIEFGRAPQTSYWVPVWNNDNLIILLRQLNVSEFRIDDDFYLLDFGPESIRVFTGLGPQLERLSLQGVIVPLQLLSAFAKSYPRLVFLLCMIDNVVHPEEDLADALPRTPYLPGEERRHELLIVIKIKICSANWTGKSGGSRSRSATPAKAARYLRKAWPNVILTPDAAGATRGQTMYFDKLQEALYQTYPQPSTSRIQAGTVSPPRLAHEVIDVDKDAHSDSNIDEDAHLVINVDEDEHSVIDVDADEDAHSITEVDMANGTMGE